MRQMSDAEEQEHKELTVKERTEFRTNWANAQLSELKAQYTKELEWQVVDSEIGEYAPLTVLTVLTCSRCSSRDAYGGRAALLAGRRGRGPGLRTRATASGARARVPDTRASVG